MRAVKVYDNGGDTLDRYTVFTDEGDVYAMCGTGMSVDIWIGNDTEIEEGEHLGVLLDEIPQSVIERIKLREQWDLD